MVAFGVGEKVVQTVPIWPNMTSFYLCPASSIRKLSAVKCVAKMDLSYELMVRCSDFESTKRSSAERRLRWQPFNWLRKLMLYDSVIPCFDVLLLSPWVSAYASFRFSMSPLFDIRKFAYYEDIYQTFIWSFWCFSLWSFNLSACPLSICLYASLSASFHACVSICFHFHAFFDQMSFCPFRSICPIVCPFLSNVCRHICLFVCLKIRGRPCWGGGVSENIKSQKWGFDTKMAWEPLYWNLEMSSIGGGVKPPTHVEHVLLS